MLAFVALLERTAIEAYQRDVERYYQDRLVYVLGGFQHAPKPPEIPAILRRAGGD